MKHYSVIGNGLSSLITAWELAKKGNSVEVISEENSSSLLSSQKLCGVTLDAGYDYFSDADEEMLIMLDELGLINRVVAAGQEKLENITTDAGSRVLSTQGGMRMVTKNLIRECKAKGVTFTHRKVASLAGLENPIVTSDSPVAREEHADENFGAGGIVELVTLAVQSKELDQNLELPLDIENHDASLQVLSLSRSSAKWDWIKKAMPKYHVIRMTYPGKGVTLQNDDDIFDVAFAEAQQLLGIKAEKMVAAGSMNWNSADNLPTQSFISGQWYAGSVLGAVVHNAKERVQALAKES